MSTWSLTYFDVKNYLAIWPGPGPLKHFVRNARITQGQRDTDLRPEPTGIKQLRYLAKGCPRHRSYEIVGTDLRLEGKRP